MDTTLGATHWVYLASVLAILALAALRREVIMPSLVGSLAVGLAFTGSPLEAVLGVFRGLLVAGRELFDILLVIGLMVAMLKALEDLGAHRLMLRPIEALMATPAKAFWALGLSMYVASSFFWPTPATALVGTLLIPAAVKTGLPPLAAAVAVNLFGHGMALSGDLIIQGSLRLTAAGAGVPVSEVWYPAALLSLTVGIVAGTTSFLLLKGQRGSASVVFKDTPVTPSHSALGFAIAVPLVFASMAAVMAFLGLRGEDAMGLLGGTASLVLIAASLSAKGPGALEVLGDHLREGFGFAIRVFSPVIPIAAFFFLGSAELAPTILGPGAPGILMDYGQRLATGLPLGVVPLAAGTTLLGIITGLDGSGFSGLPLIGALTGALAGPQGVRVAPLAALGQVASIWTGGGTLVSWAFGLVATAGLAGVRPLDLARHNLLPVGLGLVFATLVAMWLM